MTQSELIDYFNEHVFYEWLMLRCSKNSLEEGGTQLHWNVMFAAFNVSARNLYDFLNNKGNKGSNVRVDDYKLYRTNTKRASTADVTGTLALMNAQCLHMSKSRSNDDNQKIKLEKIRTVFAWVESNINDLLNSFKDDFRANLRAEWTDTAIQERIISVSSATRPSASSLAALLEAGPTSTGQVLTFIVPKSER